MEVDEPEGVLLEQFSSMQTIDRWERYISQGGYISSLLRSLLRLKTSALNIYKRVERGLHWRD